MNTKCKHFFIFISILILLSAPGIVLASDTRLLLTGSSTLAPLVLEMAKRFESLNIGVRVDVQTGGSSRGIHDARTGLADIGMVSRALTTSEHDLTAYTFAMDGIGIILHIDNPLSVLTDKQIKDIYTGEIKNWRELSGPDMPITVVNKAEGRSTLELFLEYYSLKNSQLKPHVIIGDNQQGIKTVAGNPGAIGYVSIGSAEFEEQRGTKIKLLPMAGIVASVASVRDKHFPLSRQLNLVTKGESSRIAKRFIKFSQSVVVHDLINRQFFVPLAH